MTTRRTFLKSSAAGTAAITLTGSAPACSGPTSSRSLSSAAAGWAAITLAYSRSTSNSTSPTSATWTAIVSPMPRRSPPRAGTSRRPTKDLREVLDDKSLNAVWIATPDHWHSPAAILAADPGKHVYVEKPCSHNIREGRLMVEAAKRNKVVLQVGTQSRSAQGLQGGHGPAAGSGRSAMCSSPRPGTASCGAICGT